MIGYFRVAWCSLWVLMVSLPLRAQTLSTTPGCSPKQAAQLLKEGCRSFDVKTLQEVHDIYLLKAQTGSLKHAITLAQLDQHEAAAEDLDHHREHAKKLVEEAIHYLEIAVRQNDKDPKGHAFLCDLYGQKISLGDMFTGMNVGPQAGREIKKAMALDPEDPEVLAAQGRVYLNAPDFAGGDVKKALVTFRKVLAKDPKSDEILFWLARTYRKLNDRAGFHDALDRALLLNPHNRLALAEQANWK